MRYAKRWFMGAAAAFSLAASTASSLADYTGLAVELHTTVQIDGQPFSVFRVYANFDNPGDRLVAGFGSPNYGPSIIQTRNADDTDFGDPLYNSPFNGITAPNQELINLNPRNQWDTYVTLGVNIADQSPYGDMTFLTPGFVGLSGNNFSMANAAWYTFPTFDHDNNASTPDIPPPQSVAGWDGDGDSALRVMLLQLTVPQGNNVRGLLNIDIFPPLGGGGGQVVQHEPFQSFNSYTIPGPTALGLLGLAALCARRRRR